VKKLLPLVFLFGCVSLALSQQNEPVYVNGLLAGPFICEFAENGINENTRELEPFVQNGRVYFLCAGIPANSGNLRRGFEFILSDTRKTKGVYQGDQKNFIDSNVAVAVAGFAEAGKITVTNVFPDNDSVEKWVANVKLANN
jgi:hypothetical protein